MQLAIAEGNSSLASDIGRSIEATLAATERHGLYYEYQHLLTKVRWLYLFGDATTGAALATETLPKIERSGDRYLSGQMRLLAAEGYGRIGNLYKAAILMAEAVASNPEGSLEFVAETHRIAGRLTAAEDAGAAETYFNRASRILEAIGNRTAQTNVVRDARDVLGKVSADARTPAAREAVRIASLIDFGGNGRLLANDTLALIADSDASQCAVIIETHENGRNKTFASIGDHKLLKRCAEHPDSIRMPTGSYGDCTYAVNVLPKETAIARSTLLAIERMVRSAQLLATARERDRERAAVSSARTPENQLGLICASDRMLDLVNTIRRVAASNVNVLLTGETGVGKELFARALHQASARSDRTFLPFNCATVPRDLFDSQLFGHKRGSFTGAMNDAAGVIRGAAGGTLFLDEIGEMTIETQPKLLRFLESGEILPLGETKPQIVDVRIVAATNAKLDQYVADGRFREDLYYRLNVIRIDIPPLRERREEIPALVEHFLERFGQELQKPMLRIADETLEYLVLYRWPGNVRQLANEIRRLVAMAEPGAVLMPAHLSDDIAASRRTVAADTGPRKATEVITRIDQSLSAAVEHIERAAIQRALAVCEGRLDEAAKMLGLSRKGLYLKRQRLHLD
jgi:DNA-binding NtrC family response regulator